MKLRLTLILLCLFGIGLFARAQGKKKTVSKPTVENGADAIPVTVKSNKKARHPKPPPPPPLMIMKDESPLPPPRIEVLKFVPPNIKRDVKKPAPPPPAKPTKAKAEQPVRPNAPPPPPEITDL